MEKQEQLIQIGDLETKNSQLKSELREKAVKIDEQYMENEQKTI